MKLSEILAWRQAVIHHFVNCGPNSPQENFFALWFGALEDAIEDYHKGNNSRYGGGE